MNTLLKRIAALTGLSNPSYDVLAKATFLRLARAFLKTLATVLSATRDPGSSRLSVYQGGDAVPGEVQLRFPNALLMVTFNPTIYLHGPILMYRQHQGHLDGNGGQNHFVPLAELATDAEARERFIQIVSRWLDGRMSTA